MELLEQACQQCNGKGYTTKLNLLNARTEKTKCSKCFGRGQVQVEPAQDGTIFFTKQAIIGYWQELRKGVPIATLYIHLNQIKGRDGQPLWNLQADPNNPLKKPIAKPRIFMEIVNMNTKCSYRKQGIMGKLLAKAMEDPKIEWVESSWDDSTSDGRNFLLGKGFKQVKDKLIWVRDEQREAEKL